jgi:hypothetical protein
MKSGAERSMGIRIVVALTAFWSALVGLGAEIGSNQPVATVKFRLQNGLVMVPATINDSEPLSFLLDTGYSITTIHPRLVEPLKLSRAGAVTIVGIAGEEVAPMYSGAEFNLSGAKYLPRRVAAVPSEGRRRRRDGILGSGLFRRFVVQLDFRSTTMRLFSPDDFVYTGKGVRVPLRLDDDTPELNAVIPLDDGRKIEGRFELDTGCDDGVCLGRPFVAEHKLDEILVANDGGVKRGTGGDARISSGQIPLLRLGEAEARKISASFFRDGSPAGAGRAGHIGMQTLRQFHVTLDFRRRQMILDSPDAP